MAGSYSWSTNSRASIVLAACKAMRGLLPMSIRRWMSVVYDLITKVGRNRISIPTRANEEETRRSVLAVWRSAWSKISLLISFGRRPAISRYV